MSRHHKRLDRRLWRACRAAVYRRVQLANGGRLRCELCGKFSPTFEVDHVVSIDAGGAWYDHDNLQLLCADPCHIEKTARENVHDPARLAWRDALARLQ